jgi:hypothetical protein
MRRTEEHSSSPPESVVGIDIGCAKCRRHDMFIDAGKKMSQAPLGASCVMREERVAPTGLMNLIGGLFYKYVAPTAL